MAFDLRHRSFWEGLDFSREELRFLLLGMANTARVLERTLRRDRVPRLTATNI
jgi:NhaP-type Na+/H+ or K+/H+ antiporter